MAKMSPREARKQAFLKRQKASQRVAAGSFGILKTTTDAKTWKCDNGRHDIDIIPYVAGKHDPQVKEGEYTYVLEVFVHNKVGAEEDKTFICLHKTYGKPCPICEYRKRLIEEEADEDLIESLKVSKYPRSLYNILCHDDPRKSKEIVIFNTSHFLFEKQLVEMAQSTPRQIEEGYDPIIDFADPEDGYGISFTREGEGRNTRITGIRFNKRKKAISEKILERAYVLDEIIHIPTYDEVYEAFWGQSREDKERDEEEEDERRPSRKSSRSRDESPKRGSRRRDEEDEPEEDEDGEDDSYLNKNPKKGKKKKENECPADGVFGQDHETLDACEECDVWAACLAASEEMSDESEPEEDEEEIESAEDAPEEEEDEPEEDEEEEPEEEEEEEKPRSRRSAPSKSTGRSGKPSGTSSRKPPERTSGRSTKSGASMGDSGSGKGQSSGRRRRSMR